MAVIVTRKPLIITLIAMGCLALTICVSDITICTLLVLSFPKDAVPVISASVSVVVLQSFLLAGAIGVIVMSVLGIRHILNWRRDQTLMTFLVLLFLSLFDLTCSAGLFWIQGSLSANLNNLYTMQNWQKSRMAASEVSEEMSMATSTFCATYTGGMQAYLCGTKINNKATTYVNINGIVCMVCSLLMIMTVVFLLWYMKQDEDEPTPPPSKDPSAAEVSEADMVYEEEVVPLTEVFAAQTGAMDLSLAYDGNTKVTTSHPAYTEWIAENPEMEGEIMDD